jgi:uncharacterized protein YpmB
MKKEVILLFLVLILSFNLILAVEISLSKSSYQPQETLLAEITGNFIDTLTKDNILLYEGTTPRSQPAISDLIKQENIYYFYAVLPNKENNFSIRIENARYTESGVQKTDTIIKDFVIKRTNQSALQINPGVIKTSKDFSIKIKSLYENQDISASFDTQTESFSLVEDNEKTIVFSVLNIDAGKQDLTINDYTIPVFIIGSAEEEPIINETKNQTNQTISGTNITKPNDFSELSDDEIEEYVEDIGETDDLSCSNIGEDCLNNQECDGEKIASSDSSSCCAGTCKEKKEKSSTWIWGILILLVVVGGIAFFYFKSKKKLKPKSTEEILEKKNKDFGLRMDNKLDSGKEIRGSLGKI